MKVIFMGTPHFAVVGLKAIVEKSNHEVVAVITAADKPAGRGRKIKFSAVKEYALEQEIDCLQPKNLKSPEFVENLKSYQADCFVVIAFRMLPRLVWEIPTKGTFNLHASLLPDYRGAAPINHALINGEPQTGVTSFLIDDKIDTGAILLQKSLDIFPDENAGELHDRLAVLGAELTIETLDKLEKEELNPEQQPQESTKHAPKIFKEDCRIQWNQEGENIHNFVRGMSPYPAAWTILKQNDKEIQVKIRSGLFKYENHLSKIGKLEAQKNHLIVYVPNGIYQIHEIQLEGRKNMKINDLLNGFKIEKDAHFL